MRLALYAAGFLLLAGSAFAAPPATIQDPTNVNRNLSINADGSANVTCVTGCTGGGGGGNVNLTGINSVTPLVGAGATGTGSLRTTQAQDTTTVAGSDPATTGVYVTGPSAAALATSANQTSVQGSKSGGSAATNSQLTGGVYNSSPLTLTNTQQASTQLTAAGSTKVLDDNSAALLAAAQSGTGTTGAAVPAGAIYNGMNVSGNLTGMTGTANGLKVDGSAVTQPASISQTTPGTTNNVTVSTNVGTLPLVQATASVPITFTAAGGPTQIIGASGSTKIYVTHIHYVLSGAGTFALVTGTGTNCGTGTAYLEGASGHPLSYAANGGISAGSGLGPIYVTGAGGEICAITTGAVDISGVISYAQF